MKHVFHKVMALAMVFVVLLSTMSYTVDMHYCGDTLMDSAIFNTVKTCGMDMESPLKEDCSVTKKNCCNDEQVVLDNQDELQFHVDKISFEQQVFIASFVYSYINRFEGFDKNTSSFKDYTPPLVIKQIFKLDETYLI
ncbi:hypothetical protein ACFFU9_13980 [Mariniflexile ostreae]|uniref:Secreted protein n=1 Tax=Mariniflexile ostreae TaxID=1520892 RepID=A0ABV5FEK3_9FLAO